MSDVKIKELDKSLIHRANSNSIVDDENNSHEEPAICCTHCKAKISQSDFDSWVWNFCPVCGFKMEDETEEQHETD